MATTPAVPPGASAAGVAPSASAPSSSPSSSRLLRRGFLSRRRSRLLIPPPMSAVFSSSLVVVVLLLLVVLLGASSSSAASSARYVPPLESSAPSDEEYDPNLVTTTFDIGYGPESAEVYVDPDVSTFYRDDYDDDEDGGKKAVEAVEPAFQGMAGKFVNMSPERLMLYWDPMSGQDGSLIGGCDPFQSCGTSTFPGHRFYFSAEKDGHQKISRVATFDIRKGQGVYYYDPYDVPNDPKRTRRNLEGLSYADYEKYERLHRSRLFNDKYRQATGRDYLAVYARERPSHHMWRADYIGQEHWATTRETHFVAMPPERELGNILVHGKARALSEDQPRILAEYRTPAPLLNMTMTTLSCRPRAFEIRNFLSPVEVRHIIALATTMNLAASQTGEGSSKSDIRKIRTSRNTWVGREESPIIDAVYRRAADLMRIDEALFRYRGDGEYKELGTERSIAEKLQLVHYDMGQEYTPHHDFGYSAQQDPRQPARFATLLLYLNEVPEGGETSFPRWKNAETSDALKVTPEVGKAVLFYSQLPDGNMDDLSQHAAVPVAEGEKWLINLWVHDPIYEK